MTEPSQRDTRLELLTKKETAQLVRLSLPTLWRLQRAGKFPALRQISPGRVAWLRSEVEQWMESRPAAAGRRSR